MKNSLSLRPWKLSDAEFIVNLRNKPEVMQWFRQDYPLTLDGQTRFMESEKGFNYRGQIIVLNGKPIGIFGNPNGELCLVLEDKYHYLVPEILKNKKALWSDGFIDNPLLYILFSIGFRIRKVEPRKYYKKCFGWMDIVAIYRP